MRILHAAHFFLPNHVAGVEVYTDRLTAELSKRHDVALVYSEIRKDRRNTELRRHAHGRVHAFEITNNRRFGRFEESYLNLALLPAICEVIDEFAPDVVHVQHLMGLSVVLLQEVRRRGIPVVMTAHDHWLECAEGGQRFHRELGRCEELDATRCGACTAHRSMPALHARRWVEQLMAWREASSGEAEGAPQISTRSISSARWLRHLPRLGSRLTRVPTKRQARRIEQRWDALRLAAGSLDRILVPSRYLAAHLVAFGLPADRIAVLDYGFVREGYAEQRRLPEVARRFAFLGSMVRHKGLHVLLEAFAKMPPGARLDVCGSAHDDPSYVADFRRRWPHPGLRFVGQLEHDRVPSFLSEIDCLIVPSIWCENAPLVIREAHLSGIPVVASRLGGHIEILEKGGGLLYEADSPTALADCLRRLLGEPGLLRELSAGARPVKSMQENAAELEELYGELVWR